MNKLKSHLMFGSQQQRGVFFLFLLILIFQLIYHFTDFSVEEELDKANIAQITDIQQEWDSLKQELNKKEAHKIFPFNPNYMDDYKGYYFGMNPEEMDRLKLFRANGKFVNSALQFQDVTGISDSLLNTMKGYFKFPEWTQKKKSSARGILLNSKRNIIKKDLNKVSAEELRKVNGIGKVLSNRIVSFRELLGGFLVDEQLYDVYGLSPEVVKRSMEFFEIKSVPDINKINLNTANIGDIVSLAYFNYKQAQKILEYRSLVGEIRSFKELEKIEGFPSDKIDRIKLYLTLE